MSVLLVWTTVIPMLYALILLEPGHAFVTLGTRDQDRCALVTWLDIDSVKMSLLEMAY